MLGMKDFFRTVSRLRNSAKRGIRVKSSLLYITPDFQLVMYSIPYGRGKQAPVIQWEFIDLNCSSLSRTYFLGDIETIYKELYSIGGKYRKEKVQGARIPYRFTAEYIADTDKLKDKLEGGEISEKEYWSLLSDIQERYAQKEREEETVLPFNQSCLSVEIVNGKLQYCYDEATFDDLNLVYNPLQTLAVLTDNSEYMPGANLPPIPSVSGYNSHELNKRLEIFQRAYSDYVLPSFFGACYETEAELEALVMERQARKQARGQARNVKTEIEKTIEHEQKEQERKARAEAKKSVKSTRGTVLLYSGKGGKVYHDLADRMYLIFADAPREYCAELVGIGFSYRQDLGGVFRYGAKSEKGKEAVKKAIKILQTK